MNDLIVTICRDTRKVKTNRGFIGLNGEHLQGHIIADFTDKAEFVEGTASFELVQNGVKYNIEMTRDDANKVYKLPIKSSLLRYAGNLSCQVVITQAETADGAPVFKSDKFQVNCLEAINATETIPEQYPTWVASTDAKINTLENDMSKLKEDAEEWVFTLEDGTTVTKKVVVV